MTDPVSDFLNSLGPGLKEFVEPLPALLRSPSQQFVARLGPRIGKGSTREAYEANDNPNTVIKKADSLFANVAEFLIWNSVRTTDLREHFGEIFSISEDGLFLEMEKLGDISKSDYWRVPTLPYAFNDLKPSNFGTTTDGRIKVRDYAMFDLSHALETETKSRPGWAIYPPG